MSETFVEYEQQHRKVVPLDLIEGDLVDLARCPYLKDHPSADFEYAVVAYVRDEGEIVAVGYESIDEVGYDKSQELWIARRQSEFEHAQN